jgi:hypothetical protein
VGAAAAVALAAWAVAVVVAGSAWASGQAPFDPSAPDQPPLVAPLPARYPDAPPQPLGMPVGPGRDWDRPSPRGAVPSVRALFGAGAGVSGRPLARGISDGRLMLSADPEVRLRAMSGARMLGASVVRIPLSWRGALPAAPPRDATDPGDPAYDWAPHDAAVRVAIASGLEPLLVVSHAPPYAEAPRRWVSAPNGSWAPRPSELAAFATAVARRYSGSWPDPARPGRMLPRVRAFQAWNEPNLPQYLSPQWVVRGGRWVPWAPGHYRMMLNAFAGAVRAVQPGATVVSAGLAPNGEGADGAGRMTPVRFLRALLCLGPPPAGGPVRCPARADFDVMAFHPLSVDNPDLAAASALDVAVGDLGKVGAVLRLAERHGLLARGAPRLWVTELNWTTGAIPAARRAAAVGRGLHRLWAAGASQVTWQFLEDPPGMPDREAGLRRHGTRGPLTGAPKAYARGFSVPFDAARVSARRVAVWGVSAAGGRARVQRRRGGRWRTVRRVARVRSDRPVQVLLAARGPVRVRFVTPAGRASAALTVR